MIEHGPSQHILPVLTVEQDFRLEVDFTFGQHAIADLADQGHHIVRRGRSPIYDKVPVDPLHLGVAHPFALQTEFVDQPTGRIPLRIPEDASRAGFTGLCLLTPVPVILDPRFDRPMIGRRCRPKDAADRDGVCDIRTATVPDVEILSPQDPDLAGQGHQLNLLNHLEDPSPHGAGIHSKRSAQCAGYAFKELKSFPTLPQGTTAELLQSNTASHLNPVVGQFSDAPPIGVLKAQDKADHTLIRDNQV